jgi:predicted metal-binding protein
MEVREKYIARLLNDPVGHGFTEIKFVHTPQIIVSHWVRMRCQYVCRATRQSDLCPPFSPDAEATTRMLDEFKFGLFLRQEVPLPYQGNFSEAWRAFEQCLIEAENECFVRGYGKAFAIAAGNCLFCHHDDSVRPCDFQGKTRPTLESIGVNLYDTLDMIGWDHYLIRDPEEPFQFFGLMLLE